MKSEKKDRSVLQLLLWILVILAPLIAGWILGIFSGTSPLRLDAWNTAWNDENGYFRVIRTMRHYGVPQGVTGFNEITSGNIPFGPYNIFTYIPYYLLSFITGCSSHSYIYYCNVILAVFANLLFVVLVRPRKKSAFLLAVFFLTQLILARYTWSGMAEASYHFYIVVFMGLVIWYLRAGSASVAKKNAALLAMTLLTFCFSVMRPYFLPLFFIPLYLLIFRNPGLGEVPRFLYAIFILASMAGALLLMYFLMNYIAEYFEIAPAMRLAQIIRSGGIGDVLSGLIQLNKDSVFSAIGLIREYRWAGGIAFLFYFEWIILFFEFVFTLLAGRKDGSAAVLFLLLISGAMIYEATILLYKAYQLHRMLLAITIAYTLFLIEFGILLPWVNGAAVILVVAFYVYMKPAAFALPQTGDSALTGAQLTQYKKELVSLMPYRDPYAALEAVAAKESPEKEASEKEGSEKEGPEKEGPEKEGSGKEGSEKETSLQKRSFSAAFASPSTLAPFWENTVAKITEDDHIQLSYVMPDYLSFNICTENFMEKAIENDSFCSRYIMVKTDSRLNDLCRDKYSLLWEEYGHSIYNAR